MNPLCPKDWDTSLQHVIDDMHGRPLNIHSLMANHPPALNAWWTLRQYLVNGGDLEQRHCELVILRIAARLDNWYEWASHVVRGLDSGLTLDEIDNVRSGDRHWSEADAALLRAVDDVMEYHMICDPTKEALAPHFTDRQAMDIILLHGMYVTLACMINTWDVDLDQDVIDRLPDCAATENFALR